MSKRKTIEVTKLREYVNGFLSSPDCPGVNQELRRGAIAVLEFALMESNQYRGFRYLNEMEMKTKGLPGIRYKFYDDEPGVFPSFDNTDDTRRYYH